MRALVYRGPSDLVRPAPLNVWESKGDKTLRYNSEEPIKYVNESARTIELDLFVGRHLFDVLENIRTKEGKYPGDKG